jgi:membrane-bound lytic murein transglycosylase B
MMYSNGMRRARRDLRKPITRRLVATMGLVVALVGIATLPSAAQEDSANAETPSAVAADGVAHESGTAGVLDRVVVESANYQGALLSLHEEQSALVVAQANLARATQQIPDLRVAARGLAAAIPSLDQQIRRNAEHREVARRDLGRLVALRYTADAGSPNALAVFGDPDVFVEDRREQILLEVAEFDRRSTFDTADRRYVTATQQLALARDGSARIAAQLADALRTEKQAAERVALAEITIPELEALVSQERRMGRIAETDLSYIALEAYVTAAQNSTVAAPSCGIRWQILAGIGRVESRHGTYRGTSLDLSGRTIERIIGIPLNGENSTAVISDSDGGRLDGDVEFDRAVGPMQFIPSTWAAYARDVDGDDTADPHNLYDAAGAAAAYLCRAGDFHSAEGTRRAIRAYNHSDAYVDAVLRHVESYDEISVSVNE